MAVIQENISKFYQLVIVLLMCFFLQNTWSQALVILTADQDTICLGEEVEFYAQSINCIDSATFSWYLNGDSISTNNTGTIFLELTSSLDLVMVILQCMNNGIPEIDTALISLTVYEASIDAGIDQFVDSGTAVILTATGNVTQFTWSPSYLLENPNASSTSTQTSQTTTFMVQGTLGPCLVFDYVTVFITNDFDIPNTFSPNNDGVNDTWIIPGIASFPENYMIILNRFGNTLYESSPYNDVNAWSGNFNDKALPEGVYYYFLETGVGSQVIKGTISIVR